MTALDWPVLTRYDADHVARIALPLGGIGTGTISLGGRGNLRDFEMMSRPAKGNNPTHAFFAVAVEGEGGWEVRALEGPLADFEVEGGFGSPTANHGLPRFRDVRFEAAYPLGQVLLADDDLPDAVRLQAFNPLVPADVERSSLPLAVLRYVVTNRTNAPRQVTVCGTLPNLVGAGASRPLHEGQPADVVSPNRVESGAGIHGIVFGARPELPETDEHFGSMALAAWGDGDVSSRTGWAERTWGDSLLDFWDDLRSDGALTQPAGKTVPLGSVAQTQTIPAGESAAFTFIIAWHFPNRVTWTPRDDQDNNIGNFYASLWRDAWDVVEKIAPALPGLEADTVRFVDAFLSADLPQVVQEAALNNLSTLRSQTVFRTRDGHFFGWEGCGDTNGCCHGTCTHVWNYEQATGYLFGSLARDLREVEFLHATDENGLMSFRVELPLETRARTWRLAAADGQLGCLMKLYRDWKLCGDDAWFAKLWPAARRALEFCWIPGGWDSDRDGVMEGCQHNTMDVEYYGPNPQMELWYLGALRAAEEMARHQGERAFADVCRSLFERGRAWTEQNLFNGEYYEHEIRPIADASTIAAGLRHESMGADDAAHPVLQLGAGCLVDQLVGQYFAHVVGLGYLVDPEQVKSVYASLMRYNFKKGLWSHFNHLRTFALQGEAAMLMCSYPKGRRPERPFPYFNEVMTGFEYTAAVGMLQEGLTDDGLTVIGAIRARYDGRRRSPFDEAECGHHYARAMASWGVVLALSGFSWDAHTGAMGFSKPGRHFWSTGDAWGIATVTDSDATVEVLGGTIEIRSVRLRN